MTSPLQQIASPIPTETLNFAAELRLPGSMKRRHRLARVHETLMDTDLLHVADTRVGACVRASVVSRSDEGVSR